MTRDLAGQVVVYADGVQRLVHNDAANAYGVINAGNTLRFFKDDAAEDSGGSVARIRLFTCALSPAEVAALDRAPSLVLSDWALDASGRFYFKITGPPAAQVDVQRSRDLITWTTPTNLIPFTGEAWYTNPPTAAPTNRFFRAFLP
jgi:hypothetical protein